MATIYFPCKFASVPERIEIRVNLGRMTMLAGMFRPNNDDSCVVVQTIYCDYVVISGKPDSEIDTLHSVWNEFGCRNYYKRLHEGNCGESYDGLVCSPDGLCYLGDTYGVEDFAEKNYRFTDMIDRVDGSFGRPRSAKRNDCMRTADAYEITNKSIIFGESKYQLGRSSPWLRCVVKNGFVAPSGAREVTFGYAIGRNYSLYLVSSFVYRDIWSIGTYEVLVYNKLTD